MENCLVWGKPPHVWWPGCPSEVLYVTSEGETWVDQGGFSKHLAHSPSACYCEVKIRAVRSFSWLREAATSWMPVDYQNFCFSHLLFKLINKWKYLKKNGLPLTVTTWPMFIFVVLVEKVTSLGSLANVMSKKYKNFLNKEVTFFCFFMEFIGVTWGNVRFSK